MKKFLLKIYFGIIKIKNNIRAKKTEKYLKNYTKQKNKSVFYLGTPVHNNLGDLAQYYCIDKWIKTNLYDYNYIKISADDLLNKKAKCLDEIKRLYEEKDIIIFQSGYTTTDLGGIHDEMHKVICKELKNPYILMMPQTIFFKDRKRENESAEMYSLANNMLFLARDEESYKKACKMFKNIHIKQYPDIVTSLIGTYRNRKDRNGIYMCCRDDSEKYYTDEEITKLMLNLQKVTEIQKGDTTLKLNPNYMRKNIEKVLYKELDFFSKHKLVITDRYHGTIFSLISNTPVIVIKTNDHKVVTGVNWFKGIYDEYVYYADNLEDAEKLALKILNKNFNYELEPYFEKEYYENLLDLFKSEVKY